MWVTDIRANIIPFFENFNWCPVCVYSSKANQFYKKQQKRVIQVTYVQALLGFAVLPEFKDKPLYFC